MPPGHRTAPRPRARGGTHPHARVRPSNSRDPPPNSTVKGGTLVRMGRPAMHVWVLRLETMTFLLFALAAHGCFEPVDGEA